MRLANFWSFLVDDTPKDWQYIITENYTIWLLLYSAAWLFLYVVKATSKVFAPFKLNPGVYPPNSLVWVELLRSARGILICSIYEMAIHRMFASGLLPCFTSWGFSDLVIIPVAAFWMDTHFYWTHRLLHIQAIYTHIHKMHHESFNPDPWSGLSMHWVEHVIYFSAAPLLCWCCPLWLLRLIFKVAIVGPLPGHWGFGSWALESTHNHYVHHAKFNWNYGASPIWDHLMGTNYVCHSEYTHSSRSNGAIEQARQVGVRVGNLK